MNSSHIQALGLIDPENIGSNTKLIADIKYPMFTDKTVRLYRTASHYIFWAQYLNIFTKKMSINQEEFPLESLDWVIKQLQLSASNIPFKKPQSPGDVTVHSVFSSETVGLSPMRHCCAEDNPGCKLWNSSRVDYVTDITPQSREIPRDIIASQVLPALEKCR